MKHAEHSIPERLKSSPATIRCIVTRLAETRDLSDEREVMDMVQRVIESCPLVSAVLEVPKVIMCILWSFLLTMVRNHIQRSAVLTAVSGYDADHMGIWSHDDPGVTRWNTPSLVVGDDAGDKIDPSIEVES